MCSFQEGIPIFLNVENIDMIGENMAQISMTKWLHNQLLSIKESWEVCVDATAGNGHDTLFLFENCASSGKVIAFDIQKAALEATENLLTQHDFGNVKRPKVQFILDGHEHMDEYIESNTADIIMFNLGYLPGGDHALATNSQTTIPAIKKGLEILKVHGVMSICIYSGGDTGFQEKEEVLAFLKQLPQKQYTVIVSEFYNLGNCPPTPVIIRKRR